MRTNPLASTALMLLACEPKSPDRIVDELQEVASGPLMYPASVCDSVPFQLAVGLDAAGDHRGADWRGNEAADREARREARQFEVVAGGSRSNTITLSTPVSYATEPPVIKPRSKRGQRGRRWP